MEEFTKENSRILFELANIVGNEWVSNEPEIIYAHSRDVNMYPDNLSSVLRPPHYVVLPANSEEVQKIVSIAKNHKIPITVQTTGLNIAGVCVPPKGGILMDMKRLDKVLEIDEVNCRATIQPYVTIARLSCELQKRKLFLPVLCNPLTASVISNIVVGLGLMVTICMGSMYEWFVGF